MYEFILRKHHNNVYDIYKDNERIRDENDFCVKIDEENKRVAFFNAWTAHKLVNVNDIIYSDTLTIVPTVTKGATGTFNIYVDNKL